MINNVAAAMSRISAIQSAMSTMPATRAADRLVGSAPEFSAMLSQQVARAEPRPTISPAMPQPFAPTSASGAPPGLEGFGNGQIPTSMLAPITGGEFLWSPAASAFNAMAADAASAGVSIGVTDAYRPLEDQHRLAAELGLYSQGGRAAVPGTSEHGWGRALDLDLDDTAQAWIRENGWRYGFRETVPGEPWHWEYQP